MTDLPKGVVAPQASADARKAAAAEPQTLAEARSAVERSRQRIADTLDSLEDRIIETKQSIRRKADVARPAREAIRRTPLIALGVAFAIGVFLGTRGGSDDEVDAYGFARDERKALEEWRMRRRKMLLEEAEDANEELEDSSDESGDEDGEPGILGRWMRSIGREVAGVGVGIVAAEIAERLYGARSEDEDASEDDVGDEFEDDFDEDFHDDFEDDGFDEDLIG